MKTKMGVVVGLALASVFSCSCKVMETAPGMATAVVPAPKTDSRGMSVYQNIYISALNGERLSRGYLMGELIPIQIPPGENEITLSVPWFSENNQETSIAFRDRSLVPAKGSRGRAEADVPFKAVEGERYSLVCRFHPPIRLNNSTWSFRPGPLTLEVEVMRVSEDQAQPPGAVKRSWFGEGTEFRHPRSPQPVRVLKLLE